MKKIHKILDSPEEWEAILRNHYLNLSEELNRIDNNKKFIETCLNSLNHEQELSSITRQLAILNQSLELEVIIKSLLKT